ncbi:hypothetical protein C4580_02475 [Candidatus Woesearchaeota archaeon]|nr:MAG: hypothetical protein C4580_02475 [Candidatus Woesearchaeota archaeon]
MADKKEVNILLLGIVAILAIVGLVLMFTSPAATGKAFTPPPLPPNVETPAPVGYDGVPMGMQAGQIGNAIVVPALEGSNLPRCPNGAVRTREQGNIPYEAIPGRLCNWYYCPGLAQSADPSAKPMLACVQA